jgi:hypothetical protein
MMDEVCRSDKRLGDGQVKPHTCFNFRYICGAPRLVMAGLQVATSPPAHNLAQPRDNQGWIAMQIPRQLIKLSQVIPSTGLGEH